MTKSPDAVPAVNPVFPSDDTVREAVRDSDLSWVAEVLRSARDGVLLRWLEAASAQPFHHAQPERAVADHIPALYDALVDLLDRGAYRGTDPGRPLDDPRVLQAAQAHARARGDQGLGPTEIVIEFRLLRREIGSTLRRELSNADPTRDVVGAQLVVNDAIDGAISFGLTALMNRIHELRQDTLMMVVHELRQPITALNGWAQLIERQLADGAPDLERARGTSHRIHREVERLSEIVNAQVERTRIVLGEVSLEPTKTNLIEMLEQAVTEFGDEIAERVRMHVPPNVDVEGYWDPNRIGQVLRNVLSNAVKYSPNGTPVDISVDVSGDGDDIAVRIRDQGFGIEPSELTRIFDHRHRGEEAIAHGIQGWGIGLFLCRSIVDAHGGRIWAESAGLGQGTTIHLLLPRQAPE